MKEIYLTSSPYAEDEKSFIKNDFVDNLKASWKRCSVLYIASFPDDCDKTDSYAKKHENIFRSEGFEIDDFVVLDHRNAERTSELLFKSGLVILTGGHCMTEHKFFEELNLKSLLSEFDGIVIGVSAGSMNSAAVVYAPPEYDEEAIDENFIDSYEGLGLTEKNIMPHYVITKEEVLGGMRMLDDILIPGSFKRDIYCFYDGNYIQIKDGIEKIHGNFELLRNGKSYFMKVYNEIWTCDSYEVEAFLIEQGLKKIGNSFESGDLRVVISRLEARMIGSLSFPQIEIYIEGESNSVDQFYEKFKLAFFKAGG